VCVRSAITIIAGVNRVADIRESDPAAPQRSDENDHTPHAPMIRRTQRRCSCCGPGDEAGDASVVVGCHANAQHRRERGSIAPRDDKLEDQRTSTNGRPLGRECPVEPHDPDDDRREQRRGERGDDRLQSARDPATSSITLMNVSRPEPLNASTNASAVRWWHPLRQEWDEVFAENTTNARPKRVRGNGNDALHSLNLGRCSADTRRSTDKALLSK